MIKKNKKHQKQTENVTTDSDKILKVSECYSFLSVYLKTSINNFPGKHELLKFTQEQIE